MRPAVEHSDSDEGRARGLAPSFRVTEDLRAAAADTMVGHSCSKPLSTVAIHPALWGRSGAAAVVGRHGQIKNICNQQR